MRISTDEMESILLGMYINTYIWFEVHHKSHLPHSNESFSFFSNEFEHEHKYKLLDLLELHIEQVPRTEGWREWKNGNSAKT